MKRSSLQSILSIHLQAYRANKKYIYKPNHVTIGKLESATFYRTGDVSAAKNR